ncbi:MAG TPA: phosphoglycerate kinase [Gammaproteobacteria bacterium]|nr:phosphoglycerate kinase [Gammaproteobacteria bacterium]
MISLAQLDLNQKRVLIRVDLNVPLQNGKITNDARLKAIIPTLKFALNVHACVILMSHLGRPEEGVYTEALSLKPIAERLSILMNQPVRFVKDWLEGVEVKPGEIVLCENVRFNIGEKANDLSLSKKMAALCDIFVMDAFATAHRAEASTVGIAQYAPVAAAGLLLSAELTALEKALRDPKHPVVAVVGGAKVSDKCLLLGSLLDKVDTLIVGGGLANTFIAAQGYSVGGSLLEPTFIAEAIALLARAKNKGVQLIVPIDAVVAKTISETAETRISDLTDIATDEKILDVGPKTSQLIDAIIQRAGTIVWNGPLGVFELSSFENGTKRVVDAIANVSAFSLAGGGETLAAIEKYGVSEKISYISTGGGAFLEYLEGKTLPAVTMLEARSTLKAD